MTPALPPVVRVTDTPAGRRYDVPPRPLAPAERRRRAARAGAVGLFTAAVLAVFVPAAAAGRYGAVDRDTAGVLTLVGIFVGSVLATGGVFCVGAAGRLTVRWAAEVGGDTLDLTERLRFAPRQTSRPTAAVRRLVVHPLPGPDGRGVIEVVSDGASRSGSPATTRSPSSTRWPPTWPTGAGPRPTAARPCPGRRRR